MIQREHVLRFLQLKQELEDGYTGCTDIILAIGTSSTILDYICMDRRFIR